jgi:hypothetical protein
VTEPAALTPGLQKPKDPATDGHANKYGRTLEDPKLSLLREWLLGKKYAATEDAASKNPDPNAEIIERWKKIGWDVFERKALLLAAARDLDENNVPNPLKLAATDIFVEKAQGFLTERGKTLYRAGIVTSGAAIVLLLAAAALVYHADVKSLLGITKSSDTVSNQYLTTLLFKSTTAGAFIAAVAYFLVSLSRALLHESTVLYSRRHSLRFGRLFVYLKSDEMTREDLEAVFNWNAEFSTAFKDIQAENITKSPIVRLLETPTALLKSTAELVKSLSEVAKPLLDKERESSSKTSV